MLFATLASTSFACSGLTLRPGDSQGSEEPASLAGLSEPIVAIDAGDSHTCVVAAAGVPFCWGSNRRGQRGTDSQPAWVPREVAGVRLTAITAGRSHSCGLDPSGSAWCWGANDYGQLGTGGRRSAARPSRVSGGLSFRELTAGGDHTCGLTHEGHAFCWGDQWEGTVGSFRTGASVREPLPVTGDRRYLALSAGGAHTCGIVQAGRVLCWGATPTTAPSSTKWSRVQFVPVEVDLPFPVVAIGTGGIHTCGLSAEDRILCWGPESPGDLASNAALSGPVDLPPGARASRLTVGGSHACALTLTGDAYCWGNNDAGQLGDGTTSARRQPTRVELGARVRALTAGLDHTCAILETDTVACWGRNDAGQVGDSIAPLRAEPVRLQTGRGG